MLRKTIEKILADPKYRNFLVEFSPGDVLCVEGEKSQDLCILISGVLEVFRGQDKIQEIDQIGSVIGEISFLLGVERTATVKTKTRGRSLIIPREEVGEFLEKFPAILWQIPRALAQKVEEVSHVLYGMKQLCDQLPDAVVITDAEGKIIAWNKKAEALYGRKWDQMHHKPAEHIYESREEFLNFLNLVLRSEQAQEKVLKVKHPEEGVRYVSTRASLLFDSQQNLQGVVFVGRDVSKSFPMKARRARLWALPFAVLGLIGVFFAFYYLYFGNTRGKTRTLSANVFLGELIERDRYLLESLLVEPVSGKDEEAIKSCLEDFVSKQLKGKRGIYRGIAVLDRAKRVIGAETLEGQHGPGVSVGISYSSIDFEKIPGSEHYILTVYRTDAEHPMGRKGTEMAFRIRRGARTVGWIIFQMDMEFLKKHYNIGEKALRAFRFNAL